MALYNPCSNQIQLDVNSLVQIFSFLEIKDKQIAAQVCEYWRDIVYTPSFWKNVRVVLHNNVRRSVIRSFCQRRITRFVCRGSTDEDLALLFKTHCNIASLEINSCRNVTQWFLQNNLGKLNELVSLHITECSHLNLISLYCDRSLDNVLARLKSLTISRCRNSAKLQKVLEKCPSLEEIFSDGYLALELVDCLEVLPKSCPKLQHLKLGYEWFNYGIYKERLRAALQMLNIKALDLEVYLYTEEVNVREVADIFHNLESLTLRVFGPRTISVDTLDYVFNKNQNLKHFSIDMEFEQLIHFRGNVEINEKKLCHAISKMTKLESLSISLKGYILSGEMIYNIIEGMPNLKQLEIGEVGDISIEYADLIGDQLQKLRSLKITSKQNEGTGIGTLCSKLPNIRDLKVKHDRLLNRDVKQMSTSMTCSSLKSLSIAGSKKIKDDGIQCIASSFKSLISLDASSCSLSDSGLALITEHLNHLQRLSVTGKKITNFGAIMIGNNLKELEHLKISGTKIADQGFVFICNQLPRLQTLEAVCKLMTDQGFKEGAKGLGRLTILHIESHKIRSKEFIESTKHLKRVVELTIRSIAIDHHCVKWVIKQMPCLSKLIFYCCSPGHRISPGHFMDYHTKCDRVCQENGITCKMYHYPCREHDYATRRRQSIKLSALYGSREASRSPESPQ